MVTAYVVGGGVTGLNFAREYARLGHEVIVLEGSSRFGGLAGYIEHFGRPLDLGPHIFHTPDSDIEEYLKESFPGLFFEREHWSKNLKGGVYFNYPISNDYIESLDKVLRDRIKSELSSINEEAAANATTYYEYITAIAGPTLRNMFFTVYPKKLWGVETTQLDANWAPKRVQIKKNAQPFYGDQWSAVGINGTKSIIDDLVRQCRSFSNVTLLDSCEVTSFRSQDGQIVGIETTKDDFNLKENDIVINTASLTRTAKIMDLECHVDYRGVALCFVHTTNTSPFPEKVDFIYVDDPDVVFNRISDQNTFVAKPEKDSTVLCCEITYSKGDSVCVASDEDISKDVVAGFLGLGLLSDEEILGTKIVKLPEVYPMFKLGYRKAMTQAISSQDLYKNYYSLGSLAEFAYADLQILFAKSRDLARLIGGATSSLNKTSFNKPQFQPVKSIDFLSRVINDDASCFNIAEIGLNHNGSLTNGYKLIDAALEAGFDAVKFQSYKSEGRSSQAGRTSRYVEKVLGTELTDNEMFAKFELSYDDHVALFKYAQSKGIPCFSAPFDLESVDTLNKIGVSGFKIASMELTNLELIEYVAKIKKPIILSTGMASLSDIEEALAVCFGAGNHQVALLHCCSVYPAPAHSLNLSAIKTLRHAFRVPVGYSDHYDSDIMSLVSLSYGAKIIEKHVTLSRDHEGPDHVLSLEPAEQIKFIRSIKEVESAIGNGIKSPSRDELKTELRFKKSFYFNKTLNKGDIINERDIELKAPCIGLLPKFKPFIVGSVVTQSVFPGDPVELENLSNE